MTIHIQHRVEGWYKISVKRADGSERLNTGWFKNLITNNGLDLLVTTPAGSFGIPFFCDTCCVGSGNTTPAFTDTALQTLVAATAAEGTFGASTFVEAAGATPAYWKSIASWRFATGTAAGNLSEIGAGHTATNLFSRALIVDGSGNPTTITVLSDEVLDVTYELRVYIDKTQHAFTINISGTNYSGYTQPYQIGTPPVFTYAWNLASAQANLQLKAQSTHTAPADVYVGLGAGSEYSSTQVLISAYVTGTYHLDIRYTWSQADANVVGGINLFFTNYGFTKFILWFTTAIPKQNYQTLTLDIRLSWTR